MRARAWWAAMGLGLCLAVGCMKSEGAVRMTASRDVPAAQGTVEATPTDNDNTRLKVHVKHMAQPSLLVPNATVYVVWARPHDDGRGPINLGALRVDKDLEGTLDTVTPLQRFDVFITAEREATVSAPSGHQVLSASVQRVIR